MPQLISQCTQCGARFGWNSDFQEAPLCPKCGYDTVYSGKRSATGTISFLDGSKGGGGTWPFNLFFKPKWRNASADVRREAVASLEPHGLLAGIAANDPDEAVRQAAAKRLAEMEADDQARVEEPVIEGSWCDASSVAAFLGGNGRRTRELVPSFGAGCPTSLFAPTSKALSKILPEGRCAKCKGYHVFQWSVAYSFFIPGRRGKPSTREKLRSWAKRFQDEIEQADSRGIHHVPGLEWWFDTADSAGVCTYSSGANTQWIGWSLEPLERAYGQMEASAS